MKNDQTRFYYIRTDKDSESKFHVHSEREPAITEGRDYEDWKEDVLEDCILERWPECDIQDGALIDHQIVRNFLLA